MRGSNPVLWISAVCFAVLCSFLTSAQEIDPSACEQACYERETVCVSACGQHRDPVECEAKCHDERDDCLEACR